MTNPLCVIRFRCYYTIKKKMQEPQRFQDCFEILKLRVSMCKNCKRRSYFLLTFSKLKKYLKYKILSKLFY